MGRRVPIPVHVPYRRCLLDRLLPRCPLSPSASRPTNPTTRPDPIQHDIPSLCILQAQALHLIQPMLSSTISKEAYSPPIPSRESLAKLIHPPRISTSAARCAAPTLLRRWIGGGNYNLPLRIAKCCVLNHHAACRSQSAISKT